MTDKNGKPKAGGGNHQIRGTRVAVEIAHGEDAECVKEMVTTFIVLSLLYLNLPRKNVSISLAKLSRFASNRSLTGRTTATAFSRTWLLDLYLGI